MFLFRPPLPQDKAACMENFTIILALKTKGIIMLPKSSVAVTVSACYEMVGPNSFPSAEDGVKETEVLDNYKQNNAEWKPGLWCQEAQKS